MSREHRYIVLGAGGVGCALGGMLQAAGAEVLLVARGAQQVALAERGLSLALPSRALHLAVAAVSSPRAVRFEARDVVLLCTKSQDTEAALASLAEAAPRDVPVVCAQNGVVSEGLAARAFTSIYGLVVYAPIEFLEPGFVSIHAEPVLGGLDLGRHPQGTDDLAHEVVRDLAGAGFDACVQHRIERWKYGKLLTNLGNALQALGGHAALGSPLLAAMRDEAIACFCAAGIDFAPLDEILARYGHIRESAVGGAPRGGGSTWQSLARGTGSLETDFLNGEVVRLGQAHGVATPCNRGVAALARRAAAERWPPERLGVAEIEAAIHEG